VFGVILRQALVRTDEIASIDPGWGLPSVVRRQLELMAEATQGDRSPTTDDKQCIDVGPIAVRNFEESDEEYATWLKALDYAFRRFEQLP
jgi:hypothetical protein